MLERCRYAKKKRKLYEKLQTGLEVKFDEFRDYLVSKEYFVFSLGKKEIDQVKKAFYFNIAEQLHNHRIQLIQEYFGSNVFEKEKIQDLFQDG